MAWAAPSYGFRSFLACSRWLPNQAVRLNLQMSLATLAASAFARFGIASFPDLADHVPEIVALTAFAMAAAWLGAGSPHASALKA